jgi:hypothetical protein
MRYAARTSLGCEAFSPASRDFTALYVGAARSNSSRRSNAPGATRPRTSSGYIATLDLLQVSIVAVSSDMISSVAGKPEVNSTSVFLPGIELRSLARSRNAINTVRAPKLASSPLSDVSPAGADNPADVSDASPGVAAAADALEVSVAGAFGLTEELRSPATAALSLATSGVKF